MTCCFCRCGLLTPYIWKVRPLGRTSWRKDAGKNSVQGESHMSPRRWKREGINARDTRQRNKKLKRKPQKGIRLVVLHLDVTILLGARLAGNNLLAVLVELQLGDHNVGRVDAERNSGTVGLLAVDALDVDHPLLAGNLGDLALGALGRTTDDEDLVILANGERSDLQKQKSIEECQRRWS